LIEAENSLENGDIGVIINKDAIDGLRNGIDFPSVAAGAAQVESGFRDTVFGNGS